jgi:uncharacterized protein YkwD
MDNRNILIIGAVVTTLLGFVFYYTQQQNTTRVNPITAKVTLGNRTVTVKGPGTKLDWSWLSKLLSSIGGSVSGIGTLPNNNPITNNISGPVAIPSPSIPGTPGLPVPGISRPAPPAPGPQPVPTPVPNDWGGQCAAYTNQSRTRQGLPELRWNAQLAQIAVNFAADMNKRQFMSHVDPEGRQPWDRARQQGYPSSFVGENLSWGAKGPQEVTNQWLASLGHRANIMNRQYRQIGVGVIMGKVNRWSGRFSNSNGVPYWVQLFSN